MPHLLGFAKRRSAQPTALLSGDVSVTPFLFNGMYGVMTDGNGLYHMRARFYNPEIRRFLNRDVLLGSVAEGQSLNRFGFVEGDPIKYVDPFGLARWTDAGLALLGIAGNGAGAIVGSVLLGAPEPTTLTKVAGVVVLGKSLSGIYFNPPDYPQLGNLL
jgi:RHS repeat-associated protein